MNDPALNPTRQPGDWSVWPLAEDKIRPESFGWEVTIDLQDIGRGANHVVAALGVGGFTHTLEQAQQAVQFTLNQHGSGVGREVRP